MRRFAASDAARWPPRRSRLASGADAEVAARALILRGRAHHATGADAAALADLTRGADPPARPETAGWRCSPCASSAANPGPVRRPSATTSPTWRAGCRSPNRSGTGPARRTCSAASPSSRPTGCTSTRRSTRPRGRGAGRAAADDQALATGLDGLKIAYLSLGESARLAEVLAELIPLVRRHGDLFLLSGRSSRRVPGRRRRGLGRGRGAIERRSSTTGPATRTVRLVYGAPRLDRAAPWPG